MPTDRGAGLTEGEATLPSAETVVCIEVWQRDIDGALQVSIGDSTGGYRLVGPKFDGNGERLAGATLNRRDAEELKRWADRVLGERDDELPRLRAVADLMASALHAHLEGPLPCGSSRGGTSLARYERFLADALMPEDFETMGMKP